MDEVQGKLLAAHLHALSAQAHVLSGRLHLKLDGDLADRASRIGAELTSLANQMSDLTPPRQVGTG